MTIPALVADYKKQQTVMQLKKVFSTAMNAADMMEADDNPWPCGEACDREHDDDFIEKHIKPYFKTIETCTVTTGNMCGYKTNTPWKALNGRDRPTDSYFHFFCKFGG